MKVHLLWCSCLIAILASLAIGKARAQTDFWQASNGPFAGFVSSIVSDSGGTLYAGTDGSGIFLSVDQGKNWTPSNDGLSSWSITSVAAASDSLLLVGTQTGVFKSTNQARTWERVDNWATWTYINTVFISKVGSFLVGTKYGGIYRSTDQGGSWSQVNTGLTNYSVLAFAEDQQGYIFAGTEQYRPDMGGGLHRSTDDGTTWVYVSPPGWVASVTIDRDNDVYAGTSRGRVYRSTNSGDSWFNSDSGLPASYIHTIIADTSGYLYVGTGETSASEGQGVFRSTDQGSSWLAASTGLSNRYINCFHVDRAGRLFAGSGGGGVYLSTDFGNNWQTSNPGLLNTWIHTIGVSPNGYIFAGTGYLFSGPYIGSGLFRSTDRGASWQECNSGLTSSWVHAIAFDSSNWVYAGTSNGVYRSTNLGTTWTSMPLSSVVVNALTVAPNQSIFAGSYHGVYRSTDRGETWIGTNTGLQDGSVNCLMAKTGDGFIYAGTGNLAGPVAGHVFRTTDNGATWSLAGTGIPNTYIYSLAIDSSGKVLAGTYSNGVFRSDTSGLSWESLGLQGVSIVCIALHSGPEIYVGGYTNSSGGVYLSKDNGTTWNPLNGGLTTTSVYALAFDRSEFLFAGTYRQGMFRSSRPTTHVQQLSSNKLAEFHLDQNYPNPLNPSTTIRYALPHRSHVTLTVYNTLGQQVASLVNGEIDAGYHSVQFNASNLASGVYVYRLTTGSFVQTRKMILIR